MRIMRLLEVIQRVIDRLIGPWRYSNVAVLEEVRISARDANAAKVAVSRLRTELRGEAFTPEVPEGQVRVMDGPTPRPIKEAVAADNLQGVRAGTSMTKYLEGRR